MEDAEKYLGMPVVFAEFGVSSKDPGYNSSFRDTLINSVQKPLELNQERWEWSWEPSVAAFP